MRGGRPNSYRLFNGGQIKNVPPVGALTGRTYWLAKTIGKPTNQYF